MSDESNTMTEFSILMRNNLRFSACDTPDKPTTEPHRELLRVELRDNLLSIAEERDVAAPGNTIYARRTMSLDGATVFTILPEPPPGIHNSRFFGAIGTVVLFDAEQQRRLKTTGIDKLTGDWRGWMFDAEEVPN